MEEKKKIPRWLVILLAIVVMIIIFGVFADDESIDKNDDNNTGTNKVEEKLSLEEGHTGSIDDLGVFYYIEGYLKNNSDQDFSYVQVEFATYDSDGNTLGTCIDNNSGLEANGRWKFKATCLDNIENIASYKLTKISKY